MVVHTALVCLRFAVNEMFEHHSESKLLHERRANGELETDWHASYMASGLFLRAQQREGFFSA